jgi:hypothetical protein
MTYLIDFDTAPVGNKEDEPRHEQTALIARLILNNTITMRARQQDGRPRVGHVDN